MASGSTGDPGPGRFPDPDHGRSLRCRTVARPGLRQLSYMRGPSPIATEEQFGTPEDTTDPMPAELLLAALGSCLSARIHANAASGNILVQSLELDIEADAILGSRWEPHEREPATIGYEAIRVAVRMEADASPEAIQTLVAHAVLWSPVANTLHSPVHLDVEVLPANLALA